MQTFLPYPSFERSAKCLDMKRLNKQRVEAYQILNCLLGKSNGWKNHPAVLMWKGYEDSLKYYTIAMCDEWIKRGYKDTIKDRVQTMWTGFTPGMVYMLSSWGSRIPKFIGNEKFHGSHRSNLLRKDHIWYGKFGWTESPDIPYYWPSKELENSV